MTDLDVSIRLDPRWIDIPVRDDSDLWTWASAAVEDGLRIRGLSEPPHIKRAFIQGFIELAQKARQYAVGMGGETMAAYILAPRQDMLPVTTVKLESALRVPDTTLERAAEEVVLPEAARFGDPILQEMETANGPAVKLKQFAIVDDDSQDGSEQQVHTVLVYLWLGPTPDLLVFVRAWFASPVEAELAEEALDELASSISVRLRAP